MRAQSALVLTLATALAAFALPGVGAADPGYLTSQFFWRADGGLDVWERGAGTTRTADGRLALDPTTAQPGSDASGDYHGKHFYNGGPYVYGEATSPLTQAGFGITRAVPSWDVDTPPGSWVEVSLRAQLPGGRLTKWYSAGVWAADGSTVARHSVKDQGDADASMGTDTLVIADGSPAAEALQVRIRFMAARPDAVPSLRLAAVAVSTVPPKQPAGGPAPAAPGDPARWGKILDVQGCTQSYPDGGEGWCSPTSMSMIVGYWAHDSGPCEAKVRAAVDGVYDWIYEGHGNWPFNTAYAASRGLEASVARFRSLADAEPWIAAGVPVGMSYAWKPGQLTGAPVRSSDGHLGVLVGFDANGDPVVNDPAGKGDAIRRTYRRAELENVWLTHSGGTAYLVYPPGWSIPWNSVPRP
jgi:peptidase C39-like protein